MASKTDCVNRLLKENEEIRELVGSDRLTQSELEEIAERVEGIIDTPAFERRLAELRLETREFAAHVLRSKVIDKIKRKTINDLIKKADIKTADQVVDLMEGLAEASRKTTNLSFVNIYDAQRGDLFNHLEDIIQKHDLLEDPRTAHEILRSLDAINRGTNEHASAAHKAAAQDLKKFNNYLIQVQKDAGIFINVRDDYLIRQTHDPSRIIPKKEEWLSELPSLLDHKKTFAGITSKEGQEELLLDILEDMKTGNWQITGQASKQRRSLHFKDVDSFIKYNQKYGKGDVLKVLQDSADSVSRNIALHRVFGTNPRKMFRDTIANVAQKLPKEEQAKLRSQDLRAQGNYLQRLENTLFPLPGEPDDFIVKTLQTGKKLTALSKLGAAFALTPTDMASAVAKFNAKFGTKFWGGMQKQFTAWTQVITNPAQQKRFLKELQIALDSETLINRYDGQNLGGRFFGFGMRFTGLAQITRINRGTAVRAAAGYINDLSKLPFDKLEPRFQKELGSFDIDARVWDIIKQAKIKLEGFEFISAKAIRDLPDNLFKNSAEKAKIVTDYAAMMNSFARSGALESGIRARATAFRGIPANTLQGQLVRLIMQFKSFPLEVKNLYADILTSDPRVASTAVYDNLKLKDNRELLGQTMMHGFVMAALGLWVKDLVSGKTPRDMTTTENVLEAMSKSVLPLEFSYLFDTLKGDYGNYGRSITKDLAGPAFGQVDEVIGIISSAAAGKSVDNRIKNLVKQNIPLQTSPLIQPLLRKTFMETMSSEYNSRWIQRHNERLRENNQEYIQFMDIDEFFDPRK